GRHDDGRRLLHPEPQPAADGGLRRLREALEGRGRGLFIPHVRHLLERRGARGHGQGGQGRRDDLQAFHGLQGRADGQRRGDVRLLRPLRRARRDAARPRRERRSRRRAPAALHGERNHREGHALSRPPDVEGEAANRAIMLADQAGVPLYVVHTSCIQAHEAIRRARAKGMRVYGEPLIQHLMLDEGEYYNKDWEHAARRVMSPPFRDKKNQDNLWNGLRAGSLQVVATDHCSFTTRQKELGRGDFTKIPNGTGGLEDRMPVLWTYGVGTGRLTMNEFVAVTSTNIARILNMYPRKGAI